MTAHSAIAVHPHRPRRRFNNKEGRPGRVALQTTGFWGIAGFMPTAPGEWVYAWPEVEGCPTFAVTETDVCIIASFKEDIVRVFIDIPHADIKDYLDDLILAIYRHDAEIIGAEIEWRERAFDEEAPPAWMGGATC